MQQVNMSKKKPATKKTGDVLQVAIVGVGGRGGEHIAQFLANPHTEIAYVVDADEKIGQRRAEEIGKRQGKTPKFVQDLRKALDLFVRAQQAVDVSDAGARAEPR